MVTPLLTGYSKSSKFKVRRKKIDKRMALDRGINNQKIVVVTGRLTDVKHQIDGQLSEEFM